MTDVPGRISALFSSPSIRREEIFLSEIDIEIEPLRQLNYGVELTLTKIEEIKFAYYTPKHNHQISSKLQYISIIKSSNIPSFTHLEQT